MARDRTHSTGEGTKKEFLEIFRELCRSRQPWQVWTDAITVMACSLVNVVDKSEPRYSDREKEYADCIKRLGGVEQPANLFAIVVQALERNPDQDFLGSLYMELELGSHWKGQFFTPYNISRLMAEMMMGNCEKEIEEKGWFSVCDPAVGGGAMLIAGANVMKRKNVYYHDHVMFVGQDVDRVAGMMAYIQISLMGCPGYIVIANTLTNPMVGSPLIPAEQQDQEFWYTPFYFKEVWHYRRIFYSLDAMFRTNTSQKVEDQSVRLRGGFMFEYEEGGKEIVV